VDESFSGVLIERMAARKGELRHMEQHGSSGKARLNFLVPSRGLLGFSSELKTESRGTAVLNRAFECYGAYQMGLDRRPRAAMVSNAEGAVTAYALAALEARGVLFVAPGAPTYAGHVVGECARDSVFDMEVNAVKAKKLTNVRSVGHEDKIVLPPPRVFPLEEAIVYVAPDELCEVTPKAIRLRKRILDPSERDKFQRKHARAMKGL
jgi:GTP-binding protein